MTRILLPLLLLALSSPLLARENYYSLDLELWMRPREGAALLGHPRLNAAVQDWMGGSGAGRIQIRYPGGEEGSLWAAELRDWLVALGVPSSALEVVPGGLQEAGIELVVIGE